MVTNDKRYPELPHEVRAFLETLDGEGVTTLSDMMRTYRALADKYPGKTSALDFLINARPRTFEWLRDLRPEEVDLLERGGRLVGSGGTVGRFLKWAILTFIGAFILMSQFGDAISKLLALLRGAGK